jgi:hypothetical protein
MSHVSFVKNFLLFTLRIFFWYFFFGWKFLLQAFKFRKTFKNSLELGGVKQFFDLLYLTFVFGAPPHNYYLLSLFKYKKSQWFNFIYEHESPSWQEMLSSNAAQFEKEYLASKKTFSTKNELNQLPSIPTLHSVRKQGEINWDKIFTEKQIFIKPDDQSQSRGCFILEFEEKSYKLKASDSNWESSDLKVIKAKLSAQFALHNYLIQPLLQNDSKLNYDLQCSRLITLRILSTRNKIISCFISIPTEVMGYSKIVRIDIINGKLSDKFIYNDVRYISDIHLKWISDNIGYELPFWKDIKSICLKAHEICPNIYMVGWDIAITNQGPILIEGNNAFSIFRHQMDEGINLKSILSESILNEEIK